MHRLSTARIVRTMAIALLTTAATAAFSTPAIAGPDEGSIRAAGTDSVVAGSYIVVFKSGVDAPTTQNNLLRQHGGKAGHSFRSALKGFEIAVSEKVAKRIAANPSVDYVQENGVYTIAGTQTNPPSWGLDRIDQRNLPLDSSYTYPNTASSVRAYIIDTGINVGHNDFGGRAVHGRDTVDNDNDATDCQGHGTHVAGTVGGTSYGVAKQATLVAVRVLNCQGSGTTAGVVAGIDWVTANAVKPAVANMSLGGGADSALDAAVNNSINSGITYAIASGNGNVFGQRQNACNYSPARVAAAITVGATQNNDAAASFSNFGTCVDILAPGVNITSAWIGGNTATNTISGTSMATPHVAGAAALVLQQNPGWTPLQVRNKLVADATPNVISNVGTGTPNLLLYVGNIGGTPGQDFSLAVSPTSGSVAVGGSTTATVSTATTSGAAQTVALSASGLPSGVTASFSPSSVTSGGSSTLTLNVAASAANGTYPISIVGTGASGTKSATYTLTVTGGGGGLVCSGTNGTNVNIPDPSTAYSDIALPTCNRAASATSTVEVHIIHTYRGDLRIRLVAPDGTLYLLKNYSYFDSADNVHATYTVNLSSENGAGTWRLRVDDVFSGDTGYIDSWTLNI